MAAATLPFAFVTTSTSEVLLAVTLFARGLGLGLSMMPIMAAAYFDLQHTDIPRASTTMNIVRQVGGSVATALFAVVLERQIVARTSVPGHPTSSNAAAALTETVKLPAAIAEKVAGAFAHTFWWAVVTILVAFVPTLLLPNTKAQVPGATGPTSPPGSAAGDLEDPDHLGAIVPIIAE
jgi:hypothetical protein